MAKKSTTPKVRKPKITAKQEGGNDGYCYVVRVDGKEYINGLTRSEVPYYKKQALNFWMEKNGPLKEVTSLRDLYNRASAGPRQEEYRKLIRASLENLGAEGLANGARRGQGGSESEAWKADYRGLEAYLSSMVFEYGESEGDAEENLVGEINFCIPLI